MDSDIKKFLAIAVSAAILVSGYFGNFLPLVKAQNYITALQSLREAKSWQDFQDAFDQGLQADAPFGQDEITRNLGNLAVGLMNRNAVSNPVAVKAIEAYMDKYLAPIVAREKGPSFSQTLYLAALIKATAFQITHVTGYYDAAEKYYRLGLKLSPARPQFLYGLFDMYKNAGNKAGMQEIGQKILTLWPQDERISKMLTALK